MDLLEKRVAELEARSMEQQALLDDLSQVLYAQQRTIDALVSRLERVEKKTAGEPGLVDANAQEKPPHY